jgi:hypothetical protein
VLSPPETHGTNTLHDKPAPPKAQLVQRGAELRFWRREFWTLTPLTRDKPD